MKMHCVSVSFWYFIPGGRGRRTVCCSRCCSGYPGIPHLPSGVSAASTPLTPPLQLHSRAPESNSATDGVEVSGGTGSGYRGPQGGSSQPSRLPSRAQWLDPSGSKDGKNLLVPLPDWGEPAGVGTAVHSPGEQFTFSSAATHVQPCSSRYRPGHQAHSRWGREGAVSSICPLQQCKMEDLLPHPHAQFPSKGRSSPARRLYHQDQPEGQQAGAGAIAVCMR